MTTGHGLLRCLYFTKVVTFHPSDLSFRLFLNLNDLSYRLENDLKLSVVFLFKRFKLPCKILVRRHHFAQPYEGPNDRDISLHGAPASQHARQQWSPLRQEPEAPSNNATSRNCLLATLYSSRSRGSAFHPRREPGDAKARDCDTLFGKDQHAGGVLHF